MEKTETKYVKRTQKDYSMSFKLTVIQEYGTTKISLEALKHKYGIQGDSTIRHWIEKYGNFDIKNKCYSHMEKSKDKELFELQQKIKFLEHKNARLEKELELKDMKAEFFDMMTDIAEMQYRHTKKTPFLNSQSI